MVSSNAPRFVWLEWFGLDKGLFLNMHYERPKRKLSFNRNNRPDRTPAMTHCLCCPARERVPRSEDLAGEDASYEIREAV